VLIFKIIRKKPIKWLIIKKMVSPLQFNNNFNYNIMSNGTVKFFNESKGFGFITEEGVDKDHFVHISGLIDEIREGDSVEFDLQEGKKGLNAVNVKVI
jgi:CspA family cold shock protein